MYSKKAGIYTAINVIHMDSRLRLGTNNCRLLHIGAVTSMGVLTLYRSTLWNSLRHSQVKASRTWNNTIELSDSLIRTVSDTYQYH